MKLSTALPVMAIACVAICSTAYALYTVEERGAWPKTWPKELDSVRKQARTLMGPFELFRLYEIPFTNREEFEAAWPHFLKVKTQGAPIILVRAPKEGFFSVKPAGIFIHSPPADTTMPDTPRNTTVIHDRWLYCTYFELVVDGEIVDLNRIPLPADTPIIDERFKDAAK